ncbi:MAG: hypothetical protein Rubg2KO_02200 [Rubricoccaceae bacterium]
MMRVLSFLAWFAVSGCDGVNYDRAAAAAVVTIQFPAEGDTLRVTAVDRAREPGEPRLQWTTSLPEDPGAHGFEWEFAPVPTFDQGDLFGAGSAQYDEYRETYSREVPRRFTSDPVRYYWRLRVYGGDAGSGPWTTPRSFVVVAE